MKIVGYFLIAVGVALVIYIGYSILQEQTKFRSPLAEDNGIEVIYITPAK